MSGWAVHGRIVTMADSGPAAFSGRVWVRDDGTIAAVTRGTAKGPAELRGAPVVDVGHSLVLPGLVDLHNHLAYDTLPLWAEPTRATPWAHHDAWPRAASYAASTTWPAYAFITASPAELLAYVEVKALVGGTTSIQGSPPSNRPRDGWLVRNVDDESFGTGNRNLVLASVLTATPAVLADRANKMRAGSAFVYHCGEGQQGSIVAREYDDAEAAGCLQPRFVAVHATSVPAGRFADWTDAGAVAWSPFSNLWLYGQTTDVPAARAAGLSVCLGADWAPSGSKNVLGELKVARIVSDHLGWGLTDEDLARMVTSAPGDVLFRAWGRQVGRLEPGALADLLVLDTTSRANPYRALVHATEDDVRLVSVAGRPVYGEQPLLTTALAAAGPAGAPQPTTVRVGGREMGLVLTDPTDGTTPRTWDEVVARLEAVRADPKHEIEVAQERASAFGADGLDAGEDLGLQLALDMPTGVGPVGGLPHDLGQVVVPPLQSLVHDADWLASVHGRGFHGGLLDGLARFYG